jgi:hypothetical protein
MPETVGNYTFQTVFLGQTLEGKNPPLWDQGIPYVGDYFEPTQSEKTVITVQQEPIEPFPQTPPPGPNDYWQRPIMANNINWPTVVGGNWLMGTYDASGNI